MCQYWQYQKRLLFPIQKNNCSPSNRKIGECIVHRTVFSINHNHLNVIHCFTRTSCLFFIEKDPIHKCSSVKHGLETPIYYVIDRIIILGKQILWSWDIIVTENLVKSCEKWDLLHFHFLSKNAIWRNSFNFCIFSRIQQKNLMRNYFLRMDERKSLLNSNLSQFFQLKNTYCSWEKHDHSWGSVINTLSHEQADMSGLRFLVVAQLNFFSLHFWQFPNKILNLCETLLSSFKNGVILFSHSRGKSLCFSSHNYMFLKNSLHWSFYLQNF